MHDKGCRRLWLIRRCRNISRRNASTRFCPRFHPSSKGRIARYTKVGSSEMAVDTSKMPLFTYPMPLVISLTGCTRHSLLTGDDLSCLVHLQKQYWRTSAGVDDGNASSLTKAVGLVLWSLQDERVRPAPGSVARFSAPTNRGEGLRNRFLSRCRECSWFSDMLPPASLRHHAQYLAVWRIFN